MKAKQKERWEKIRAKGKSEYILRDGGVILGFVLCGFFFSLIRAVSKFILNGYSFSFLDGEFLVEIAFGFAFSFPLGCLTAWLTWEWNEFSYSRSK